MGFCNLLAAGFCGSRQVDHPWQRYSRHLPPSRSLKGGRLAGRAIDQVRTGDQRADCQDAWHYVAPTLLASADPDNRMSAPSKLVPIQRVEVGPKFPG